MNLKARVDVNCERKDGRTDGRPDGRKTGHLRRTLLKQVRQKMACIFPTFHAVVLLAASN